MAHLKTYKMPKGWPIGVKSRVFVTRPSQGPHSLLGSMPLRILIRDALKLADTAKEANKLIKEGKIIVDGIVRKDTNFPVGLMDAIEIPDAGKIYRVLPAKLGLEFLEIKKEEAGKKTLRIEGQTTVKKGKQQIHLHDGRNILAGKNDYKTGDSVVLDLKEKKIGKHLKLQEGANVMVMKGKYSGTSGKLKSMKKRKTMLEKSIVVVESKEGNVETLLGYIMVIE